jgi:cysteine peptidase C11 family protein
MSRDIPAKKRQAQPIQLKGDGEMENMNHQEERSVADWTLMVYVGATAVLDSFAVESLKQMKRAAGEGVIVAAQFDASGRDKIRRLIFDGTGDPDASIENDVVDRFFPDNHKTPVDFLEDFIRWAYSECKATHYCLVLWTDGSLSPAIPMGKESRTILDNRRRQNFLLPVDLRATLEKIRKEPKRDKFDIIAMDACNMSMIEDVYELRDCAEFLIASEEEIPNQSFPYPQLLPLFREHKHDTMAICRSVAREYKRAYQDYISNMSTGLKKVTLSCLRLANISKVTGPLDELAQALSSAVEKDANTRQAVISARNEAKSFVVGLFADVFGFCDQLRQELTRRNIVNKELESACAKVCNAISTRDPQAQAVVGNETSEPDRCHGLSIYFPYLTDAEKEQIAQVSESKGGADLLNKSRGEGIGQIEVYYPTLQLAKNTHWDEFIAFGWSRCLIKEVPLELDARYSGQQCAIHLERYLSMLEQNLKGASAAA